MSKHIFLTLYMTVANKCAISNMKGERVSFLIQNTLCVDLLSDVKLTSCMSSLGRKNRMCFMGP